MKKIIMTLVLLGTLISLTKAQTNECIKDFDFLVQKIKADYPGYSDKVTTKTAPELIKLEQELRNKIQLYPDSCRKYLSTYADWFKDHHLRVIPVNSATTKIKNEPTIYYKKISSDSLLTLQAKNNGIEGIWRSFYGDIAIEKSSVDNVYYGISISYQHYKENQIVFKLTPSISNEYLMTAYPFYDNFIPQSGNASLHLEDRVLELHQDTRLVRKTNNDLIDKSLLYSYIPQYPNGSNTYPLAIQLSDSTFYLRIPSFVSNLTERLVKKHWKEITSTPNLIVDIRNNGGGLDTYYSLLADLIYTTPFQNKGVEWYATKNNIKSFEDAIKNNEIRNGEEGIKWTKALIGEMKKNVGGFVVHPWVEKEKTDKVDSVYIYPRRVGIIINENNASSAEQFLLTAKHSSKVTLFGNMNTAGVLDYSNAVTEDFPSKRFKLNFPMTRSRRLPENPIDNIGIAPDVRIPFPSTLQLFDRLDQWAYFVLNYLEAMGNKK